MKEVKIKEYRIPISEFKEKFGIPEEIQSINFWYNSCKEGEKKDEPNVIVEVAEEQ